MKFGMRVFTINFVASVSVMESIASHSLLLSSVNESLLLITLFLDRPILVKFGIGNRFVTPSRIFEFPGSRYGERHSLLTSYV